MICVCVCLCVCVFQIAGSSSWHARYTVLTYLQIMVFYNLFTFMSDQRAVGDVRALVIKLLEDEQLEVRVGGGGGATPKLPLWSRRSSSEVAASETGEGWGGCDTAAE